MPDEHSSKPEELGTVARLMDPVLLREGRLS
jgi:hypothetical protein